MKVVVMNQDMFNSVEEVNLTYEEKLQDVEILNLRDKVIFGLDAEKYVVMDLRYATGVNCITA